MKKIDISNGFVEIKEVVTRKISREYLNILDEHSRVTEDGNYSITPKAVNLASEYLVLAMIERVVVVDEEGVNKEIDADQEWLDNLDEADFSKLGDSVQAIFKKAREKSKK